MPSELRDLLNKLLTAVESLAHTTPRPSNATHPWPSLPFCLDAGQLADLLGVDKRTVERMKAEGQLPTAVRIHGRDKWAQDVIKRWLDNGGKPPKR